MGRLMEKDQSAVSIPFFRSILGKMLGVTALCTGLVVGTFSSVILASSSSEQSSLGIPHALAFAGMALAFALILSYLYLRRLIVLPINQLSHCTGALADRRFDFEIESRRREDEIGLLVRNLSNLTVLMENRARSARISLLRSSAFSEATHPMIMVDETLRIRDANDAALKFMTACAEDIRTRHGTFEPDKLAGEDIQQILENGNEFKALVHDPEAVPCRVDITFAGRWIDLSISEVFDDGGTAAGYILGLRDVGPERIKAGAFDGIGQTQILIAYDPRGRVAHFNGVASKRFEITDKGALGSTFEVLSGIGADDAKKLWQRIMDEKYMILRQDRHHGPYRPITTETTYVLVEDRVGRPHRVIEMARDITDEIAREKEHEDERLRLQSEQAEVVAQLRQGLSALADGDLTHSISKAFSADYDQLRVDFNTAIEQLSRTLGQLGEVAHNVQSGSSEISQASDNLSQRTENQASTLAKTAASLDELTASVQASASAAVEANMAVAGTRKNAQGGGDVVVKAVQAMTEIENSSHQISQIIGVIDDIAFQTNLLALNAGVEAARAGSAGRGFAVVASEVRALAQRSSEAASEIKSLISASSAHVEQGVALVDQSGTALRSIVESVESIATQVSDIASSSQQQAQGLSEINQGMNNLDAVTQQNSAMVEQATAASHNMRLEAENLAELISFFANKDPERHMRETASAVGFQSRRQASDASSAAWLHDAKLDSLPSIPTYGASMHDVVGGNVRHVREDEDWEDF